MVCEASSTRLTDVKFEDLELILAWRNDEEITKWMPTTKKKISWEEEVEWWREASSGRIGLYLIVHEGQRRVGYVHYSPRDGEVGVIIGEKTLWGKGVGKRAIGLLVERIENRPLYAHIHPMNYASHGVFRANGFKATEREGRSGQQVWVLK